MNRLSVILSLLFVMLYSACSSSKIVSSDEEQSPSCSDIVQQISWENYFGNNAQEKVCNEYRQILSANGISANSSFAHSCQPQCIQ